MQGGAAFRKQVITTAAAAADRELEALRLYEPQPFQEALHACRAKEVVMLKGNRAGGTLAGCVEVARAVTGQDPHGKYPKENGNCVIMGYGEGHIGRVFHKFLFRPGAFKIIKDLDTKAWRTYRPWPKDKLVRGQAGDLERKDEAKDAPPLIPKRFIKTIAWVKRREHIFSQVQFKNGWTLYAANTAGDPRQYQGFDVHYCHIDEDTAAPGWFNEMIGRTSGTNGLVRWTALPHLKNNELMDLVERAEDTENATRDSVVIRASLFDNNFIEFESKKRSIDIWKAQGDEVYRQRAFGEISLDNRLMYPTFSADIHEALKDTEPRLRVQTVLFENMGEPPSSWCRYAAIDPGHTVCAVVFLTVPPPEEFGDHAIAYDELYLRNCTAGKFGEEMAYKVQDRVFQDFIIDAQGGRLTDSGSGIQPMRQYESELEKRGIRCVTTGSGFRHGSTDVHGRVGLLRTWLSIRQDGTTKFLIVCKRCPNLALEFRRFRKKVANVNGVAVPLDEGERRNIHAIDDLEYLAAHGCEYVKPPSNSIKKTWFDTVMEQRKQRTAERLARHGPEITTISLGPPT